MDGVPQDRVALAEFHKNAVPFAAQFGTVKGDDVAGLDHVVGLAVVLGASADEVVVAILNVHAVFSISHRAIPVAIQIASNIRIRADQVALHLVVAGFIIE